MLCLLLPFPILALKYGGCEYSDVSDLRSLVNNINISYAYHIDRNAYFDVTITNVPKNVYFIDSLTSKKYFYEDTKDGEITIKNYKGIGGFYAFFSNLPSCLGITIGKKYYSFPKYNKYSNSELCEGISEFSLCQRWTNVDYSQSDFEEKIYEYKKRLEESKNIEIDTVNDKSTISKLMDFYLNNYVYILSGIIIIISIISFVIKKREKIYF